MLPYRCAILVLKGAFSSYYGLTSGYYSWIANGKHSLANFILYLSHPVSLRSVKVEVVQPTSTLLSARSSLKIIIVSLTRRILESALRLALKLISLLSELYAHLC